MSNKYEAIKKAVFFASEKPDMLASILEGAVSDVVTSLVISGADSVEIPADTSVTEEYSAKVFSQYGDEITGETVTFALKSAVTGVSISSDTVTVAKTASEGSFIVVATCGTVTAEKEVALVAAE